MLNPNFSRFGSLRQELDISQFRFARKKGSLSPSGKPGLGMVKLVAMLVFIDESGDPGLKIEKGASRFFGIVLNKDPKKLWGEGFNTKESLYKYTCGLVFQNAKPHLKNATVVVDRSGHKRFQSELRRYLRKRINIERNVVKKVKSQRSSGNNLLQLADYVAGVVNRKVLDKKDANLYGKFIATKEIYIQVWPK